MTNPRCLYCGTARPAAEARCPQCGHPWIDFTIEEALAPPPRRAPQPAATAAAPSPEVQGVTTRRWIFPLAITGAAVAVYAIVFAMLLDRTGGDDEPSPPAVGATTTPDATPTTGAGPVTTTTSPPPTTAVPTSTAAPTATTTTEPPIPALGDPIPLEELTLGAFALGPLEFGDSDTVALGRLVATFGQPEDVFEIGESDGLCPTDSGRAARFGWLTVLLRDEAGTEVLVGYRLEEPAQAVADHPTADLETISGAALGDTVARWNDIYGTSIVTTTEIEGRPHLLLLRSSDERTLLWGPLSDDDPPVVTGIYSPRPCDGGPFK